MVRSLFSPIATWIFLQISLIVTGSFYESLSSLLWQLILTLKAQITTAADDIHKCFFHCFSEKIRLDVSSQSSALLSSKDKSKKLKCRLLQFLFGALKVKGLPSFLVDLSVCFLHVAQSPFHKILYLNVWVLNCLSSFEPGFIASLCLGAQVAQWAKRWPTDLAVVSSSHARG